MNHPTTPPLPPADISVSTSPSSTPDGTGAPIVEVKVTRGSVERTYRGIGSTEAERTTGVMREVFKDRTAGEFIQPDKE